MSILLLMLLLLGQSAAVHNQCSTCNYTAAELQSLANAVEIHNLNKPISRKSLTPWTDKCTEDMDRIPMFICNAVCDKSCSGQRRAIPAGIKVKINTFRRHLCSNGTYRYCKEDYTWTVGCTCIIY